MHFVKPSWLVHQGNRFYIVGDDLANLERGQRESPDLFRSHPSRRLSTGDWRHRYSHLFHRCASNTE